MIHTNHNHPTRVERSKRGVYGVCIPGVFRWLHVGAGFGVVRVQPAQWTTLAARGGLRLDDLLRINAP